MNVFWSPGENIILAFLYSPYYRKGTAMVYVVVKHKVENDFRSKSISWRKLKIFRSDLQIIP